MMSQNGNMENRGKIIIYQTADGQTSLEVKMENETVWLASGARSSAFGPTAC